LEVRSFHFYSNIKKIVSYKVGKKKHKFLNDHFYDTIFLYCCSYNGSQVDRKNEKTGLPNTIATSLFKVHIPVTSKCVGLCTELSGTEADNEVELEKKFRPLHLAVVQKLSHGEIFEIFVVGNDVNGSRGTFRGSDAKCGTLHR